MRNAWILLLLAGCGRDPEAVTPPPAAVDLPFSALGGFDYTEGMPLPAEALAWNGRLVKATGFINPGSQVRGLKRFFLVKDRASCCFGIQPKLNHYAEVGLKEGKAVDYTPDPVTVRGVIRVEERRDGDWVLGLYWMEDAEVLP